jgi:hypothetical protein
VAADVLCGRDALWHGVAAMAKRGHAPAPGRLRQTGQAGCRPLRLRRDRERHPRPSAAHVSENGQGVQSRRAGCQVESGHRTDLPYGWLSTAGAVRCRANRRPRAAKASGLQLPAPPWPAIFPGLDEVTRCERVPAAANPSLAQRSRARRLPNRAGLAESLRGRPAPSLRSWLRSPRPSRWNLPFGVRPSARYSWPVVGARARAGSIGRSRRRALVRARMRGTSWLSSASIP